MDKMLRFNAALLTTSTVVFLILCITDVSNGQIKGKSKSIQDEISYTNDIQPIINNFCTTCHAGDDPEPYLSKLTVSVKRSETTKGKKLHIYLSNRALTDKQGKFNTQYGYVRTDLLNGLLLFPEISAKENEFTFTYLHPGKYFLTVIADMDGDGYPSPGDITHTQTEVILKPKSNSKVVIKNLNVKN